MKRGIILVLIVLAILVIAYGFFKLTGFVIFEKPVEITRSVEMISQDENGTDFLVSLSVDVKKPRSSLGIREEVNTTPCTNIYDISDGGILKFNNVIEWFFANEDLGLDAEKLESKTLTYKIRYEECLDEDELNFGG